MTTIIIGVTIAAIPDTNPATFRFFARREYIAAAS